MDPEEKIGGRPHRAHKSFNFITTMESCGLTDIGYVGAKYTWCNNRRPRKRIWKRLDRILVNDQWSQKFQHNYVRHLMRTGSDHRPLLMKCHNEQQKVSGNAMWRLKSKLQTLSRKLGQWSRESIGDIYEQLNSWESKVQQLEELDLQQNTEDSREELNKAHAEYVKWMGLQKTLLKQKSQATITDHSLLDCIPRIISVEDNELLTSIPSIIEVREAIFKLNAYSAAGLDSFNWVFFQKCWEIIKEDIMDFVREFFNGKNLTKFYSHTCLVLIPNVESPSNFSELRPISLTNFTTKIISKILAERLNHILSKLISDNQSGFMKGRLITENVMLAQEIIQGISKENRGGNIVIKLDMEKAYDRMSWSFILQFSKISRIWFRSPLCRLKSFSEVEEPD
ncbi:uncharacterized protein LOC107830320 [Nicotiana tabacum]|uniref:Uncharacterized protein LOC107830320 n=1 Tax=Nicotiana tabacum TaxID=4097 RepID=A0A1S4DIX0_TOBAC|nr:PREDICTED: uncharacterized protein LOC107830320 [Nicotiana tabacum]